MHALAASYTRSSISAISASKWSYALNLISLGLAFALFVLTFGYIHYETHYDHWVPEHENVYRIEDEFLKNGKKIQIPYTSQAVLEVLDALTASKPEIAGLKPTRFGNKVRRYQGKEYQLRSRVFQASHNFLSFFGIPVLQGQVENLDRGIKGVAISQLLAESIFGGDNPVGQVLEFKQSRDWVAMEVVAVFQNLPDNSHLDIELIVASDPDVPKYLFSRTYIRLNSLINRDSIENLFNKIISDVERNSHLRAEKEDPNVEQIFKSRVILKPLDEIHLIEAGWDHLKPLANLDKLLLFGLAGGLLLGIAAFNFGGQLLTQIASRLKEFSLRKVCGTSRYSLVLLVLMECLVLSLLALALGLLLAGLIHPLFQQLADVQYTISGAMQGGLWIWLVAVSLLVALIAAALPVLSIWKSSPATIFSGTFGNLTRWKVVLTGFVILQFAIAIAVMIFGGGLVMQSKRLSTQNLPLETEGKYIIQNRAISGFYDYSEENRSRTLIQELKVLRGLKNVDIATHVPFADTLSLSEYNADITRERGDSSLIKVATVGESYFSIFDIPLLAGRFFRRETGDFDAIESRARRIDALEPSSNRLIPIDSVDGSLVALEQVPAVVDIAAVKALGYESVEESLGTLHEIKEFAVIGNAPEFVSRNPKSITIVGVIPSLKHNWNLGLEPRPYVYLPRLSANVSVQSSAFIIDTDSSFTDETVHQLKDLWHEHFPGLDFNSAWLQTSIDNRLRPEQNKAMMFTGLIIVTLLICVLGLYYAVSFSACTISREMAIRKVFGTAPRDIIKRVFWTFTKPILLAHLIGMPLGYILLSDFLSNYADRIQISPWLFITASVISFFILLAVVGRQAHKMANRPPVGDLLMLTVPL